MLIEISQCQKLYYQSYNNQNTYKNIIIISGIMCWIFALNVLYVFNTNFISQVNEAARASDSILKKESPSPSFPEAPCAMSTWPNLQDTLQFEKAAASIVKSQRPHTISSGTCFIFMFIVIPADIIILWQLKVFFWT